MKNPNRCFSLIASALLIGTATSQAILVTHYTFEGNGNDVVGTRNLTITDGTVVANNLVTGGIFSNNTPSGTGQSLLFDGATTRAIYDVLAGDSLGGTFTISLYVNYNVQSNASETVQPKSFFGTRGPVEYGTDIKFIGGNLIHADLGNGVNNWVTASADASFTSQINTWYNVAYVVTPTAYTIYVDGNQVGTSPISGSTTTPILFDENHDIAIGNSGVGAANTEFMSGWIDDVRIYSSALTQSEIQANLVPEPSSAALLALGMLGAIRRRR